MRWCGRRDARGRSRVTRLRCSAAQPAALSSSRFRSRRKLLFRDYVYLSSVSDTFVAHARALVERVMSRRNLGANALAVEIASNDGYLSATLSCPRRLRFSASSPPATSRASRASNAASTLSKNSSAAISPARLAAEGRCADVIHANNVLAHVPDLNGVLAGIRLLLKDDGEAIVEVPSLRDMIDRLEFDTIYHEHVFYFSLTALERAFARQGLTIVDVEHLDVHGGSLRMFARRADDSGSPNPQRTPRCTAMLEAEHTWGVDYAATVCALSGRRCRV